MSFAQFGKYTGLRGQQRDEEEFVKHQNKKMKYYTTNYFDTTKDLTGNQFHDGFGTPSQEIEKSTSLRGQITNPKIRHEWGALPINGGGISRSGPTIDHSLEKDRKTCNPEDNQFYNRSFYTLDIDPNAVQKSNNFRGGVDTRNDTRRDYLR